jgi:cell division protein FtsW
MSVVATSAGRVREWSARHQVVRTPNSVLLVLAVAVLNVVGLVMVLSASSVQSLDSKGDPWWFFQRQLLWTTFGAIAFIVASRFDHRHWRRFAPLLLAVAFVLLTIVLIPGIGIHVDGARRWLGSGQFRLQPSEIAKFALLVFCADVLARRQHEVDDWRRALRPIVSVLVVVAVLMMLEPDLASFMVIAVMVTAMLIVGGIRARHLATLLAAGVAMVTMFSFVVPWRRARMFSFFSGGQDAHAAGYQVTQSMIALVRGGWTGVGLGAGRAKWHFLPAAHTDFIFAVIGEELGLLGCALVVGLFVLIAVIGIRTATRAPDRFGTVLAVGATAWIVGQAILNLGAVVGVLPVTGVPLPFVSFGGTALVSTMVAAGVLVNVARQGASATVPNADRAATPAATRTDATQQRRAGTRTGSRAGARVGARPGAPTGARTGRS